MPFTSPAELFAKAGSAPLHHRLAARFVSSSSGGVAAWPATAVTGDVIYGGLGVGSGEMGYVGADGRRLRRKMDTPTEFEVLFHQFFYINTYLMILLIWLISPPNIFYEFSPQRYSINLTFNNKLNLSPKDVLWIFLSKIFSDEGCIKV